MLNGGRMVSPSIARTTVVGARVPRDLGNRFRRICEKMGVTYNDVIKDLIFAFVMYHEKGIISYDILEKYFGVNNPYKQSKPPTIPTPLDLSRTEVRQPPSFTKRSTKELTVCPYCGSSDVKLKSGDTWYCRDCGRTFEVPT